VEEERRALATVDDGAGSEKEMSFWDHTAELANRMKIVVYTVFAVTVLMMVLPANLSFTTNPLEFYEPLVATVLKTIRAQALPPGVRLIGLELSAPLELYVIASFAFGLMFSAPVIVYEIHQFVNPALYKRERRMVYPFIISTAMLMIVGALFGFFVVAPFAVRGMILFFPVAGAEPLISVMDFYTVVLVSVLMTAFGYTLPVFIVILVRLGIISTAFLRRNRKYLYPAMIMATLTITPDGGPLGDTVLFLPLITLMELGIYVAKRYEAPEEKVSPPSFRCEHCGRESTTSFIFCPKCGKAKA